MISIALCIIICISSFGFGMAWQAQRTKDRLTNMKTNDGNLYDPETGLKETFQYIYEKIVP